jgi:hypothetical protein
MSNGKLKELPLFWADNCLSKTQYYYLKSSAAPRKRFR